MAALAAMYAMSWRTALLVLGWMTLGAVLTPAGAGDIYRCKQPDGVVAYSQQPCRQGQPGGRIVVEEVDPLQRLIGPWRCAGDVAELARMQVDASESAGFLAGLPEAQRASLQQVAQGYALGMCHLHGAGCSGSIDFFRDRRGVVFICANGSRQSEARILEDGRIYLHRTGDHQVRVTDPRASVHGPDHSYRVDLQGQRIRAPVVETERPEGVPPERR